MTPILLLAILFTGAMAAYVLEEFVLIKPRSTIAPFAGVRLGGAVNALGGLLCVAGLTLRYVSRKTLGRFFTLGVIKQEGHTVVEDGPYRYVRHPGYFGFAMFYLGLPLLVGNWLGLAVLSLPALVALIVLVGVEDKTLADQLGEPYRAYQQRTRRFFPGIW
jgi:protein-S-isoprenylcysteine O-methyltransferase Ste14